MTDFYNFQEYFCHQSKLQGSEKTIDTASKDEIIAVAQQLLINFQVTEFERRRLGGLADQFEAELNLLRFNNPPPQYAQVCLPPPAGPPSPDTNAASETLRDLREAGIFGGAPAPVLLAEKN